MKPEATHLLETIQQRTSIDHILSVGSLTVHVNDGHTMVSEAGTGPLAVMSYYCALCFREAADNGGANAKTGSGPCVHKAAAERALALVAELREGGA